MVLLLFFIEMFVAYWQDICEIRKSEATLLSKQICFTQSGCDDTSCMLCEGGKCLWVSGNFAIMLAVNAHSQIAAWEGGTLVNMLVLLLAGCVYVCVLERILGWTCVEGCSYLIYSRERGAGWGKGVVDKEEECLLWSQRHTLAYQEAQLAN